MTCDGPSLLLEVFLVRLASHLELFMSFLSPTMHSFLILLSCHLFALWSLTICWTCWFVHPLPMSECFYCRSCFMTLIFFHFVPWSSSIRVEWTVSSFCKVIGVHHVPCFISNLNSSCDLPKLNWVFPIGVSTTKYPVSTKAYYRLKNQPRHLI